MLSSLYVNTHKVLFLFAERYLNPHSGTRDVVLWGRWSLPVTFNTTERYDPATDTWQPVAPMATPRDGCGTAMVAGKLYAVGGYDGAQPLATAERYADMVAVFRRNKCTIK